MNAVSVHGEGDVFAKISRSLGRRRQYGPAADRASGIATLSAGCVLCAWTGAGMYSSGAILFSSTSSSSNKTEGAFNEDALEEVLIEDCVSERKDELRTAVTFGRNALRRESRVAWPESDPENQPRPCRAGCGKHARLDDEAM
jgi:hypothetical protein